MAVQHAYLSTLFNKALSVGSNKEGLALLDARSNQTLR